MNQNYPEQARNIGMSGHMQSQGGLAAQTQRTTIVTGIERVEELEKRMLSVLDHVIRVADQLVGGQPMPPSGSNQVEPPRPCTILPRLIDTTQNCHALLSRIDDQLGRIEVALIG